MTQQVATTWLDDLQSTEPVLVDFYGDWCGPCRKQSPVIDELAAEGIKTLKVNIDDEPEVTAAFKINSLPTLLIFRNGEVVNRLVGFRNKESLRSAIQEAGSGS